jgi:hypothetical protein
LFHTKYTRSGALGQAGVARHASTSGSEQAADTVKSDITRYRSIASGRYHEARDLARKGEFERAERILKDLAQFLPDTKAGTASASWTARSRTELLLPLPWSGHVSLIDLARAIV